MINLNTQTVQPLFSNQERGCTNVHRRKVQQRKLWANHEEKLFWNNIRANISVLVFCYQFRRTVWHSIMTLTFGLISPRNTMTCFGEITKFHWHKKHAQQIVFVFMKLEKKLTKFVSAFRVSKVGPVERYILATSFTESQRRSRDSDQNKFSRGIGKRRK